MCLHYCILEIKLLQILYYLDLVCLNFHSIPTYFFCIWGSRFSKKVLFFCMPYSTFQNEQEGCGIHFCFNRWGEIISANFKGKGQVALKVREMPRIWSKKADENVESWLSIWVLLIFRLTWCTLVSAKINVNTVETIFVSFLFAQDCWCVAPIRTSAVWTSSWHRRGEKFLDPLMCDFWWTRANVMYMREKTPIREGTTLPGKSYYYFFETNSNFDKGHESNQTLRQGQKRNIVCACVFVRVCLCVQTISGTVRLWDWAATNKIRQSVKERRGKFQRSWTWGSSWGWEADTL